MKLFSMRMLSFCFDIVHSYIYILAYMYVCVINYHIQHTVVNQINIVA